MKPLLLLGFLIFCGSVEASLHCGNRLVNQGDPQYYVAKVCPEPFWVERWQLPIEQYYYSGPTHGRQYSGPQFEAWYINFGPRKLIRRLVFRNGYLEREESLGRGVAFRPGSRRCSPRELRVAGNSVGEVYANCGEPDHLFSEPVVFSHNGLRGGFHRAGRYVFRSRWIYDFGSRRFDRELIFEDGRLVRINEIGKN